MSRRIPMDTATIVTTVRKPGRPMKLGRIVFDERSGARMGVYAGRCEHCNDKVVLSQPAVQSLCEMYNKERKKLINHLANWIRKHREL